MTKIGLWVRQILGIPVYDLFGKPVSLRQYLVSTRLKADDLQNNYLAVDKEISNLKNARRRAIDDISTMQVMIHNMRRDITNLQTSINSPAMALNSGNTPLPAYRTITHVDPVTGRVRQALVDEYNREIDRNTGEIIRHSPTTTPQPSLEDRKITQDL